MGTAISRAPRAYSRRQLLADAHMAASRRAHELCACNVDIAEVCHRSRAESGDQCQREKRPGGGASGHRLGSHLVARSDAADCPSVPSGLTASVESGIGGFFGGSPTASVELGIGGFIGGSTTVCRCGLRCILRLWGPLAWLLGRVFSGGGATGVASGNWSADTPPPLGSFWDSTHRKKVSFSSSIAAHPERLMLADTAIEASATRAQARIETLGI
jgi:hypothetical protein